VRFSLLTIFGVARAMGCDDTGPLAPIETAPASIAHRSEHTTSRGTFELRGFEDCVGELVIVTGELRFKEHIVTSTATGNEDHSQISFFLKGTGVGQVTGTVYKFREVSRLQFNTPDLAAPHATITDKLITHLIGPGSQPKVKIRLTLHMVINGQGVTKVVVGSDKSSCSV
jgi:hypothetical protein